MHKTARDQQELDAALEMVRQIDRAQDAMRAMRDAFTELLDKDMRDTLAARLRQG